MCLAWTEGGNFPEDVMQRKDKVEGEGSYSATKGYLERIKKFIKSGRTEQAAREAAPKSAREEEEMKQAERVGKAKAKGEDPALRKK
jgi:hypothetical protein